MKRSIWTRILAMLLIVSMLTVPVSAAGWNSRSNPNGWGWGNFWGGWGGFWGGFWGGYEEEEPEPTEPEAELVLVEDASTVDNGELLRASTYALTTEGETAGINAANTYSVMATDTDTQAETTTVKYFPVTMYDYNTATINAATKLKDTGSNEWEGLYFSGGTPAGTTETDLSNFVAGQYYIQNIRAAENNANSWISYHVSEGIKMIWAESKENATLWTLEVENGRYYLSTTVDGTKLYLTMVGTGADGDTFTEEKTEITISAFSGNSTGVQLSRNEAYLCQWGSETATYYGGWTNNDPGNGMRFYAVDADGNVSDIPTTLGGIDVHTDLTWAQVQAGTYYADGACTKQVTVSQLGGDNGQYESVVVTAATDWEEFPEYADGFYYYNNNGTYERITELTYLYGWYVYTEESGDSYRYVTGNPITIYKAGGITGYTLTAGGETLATLDGTDTSAQVGVTLYTPGTVTTTQKLYAAHNHWNKASGNNSNGDLIWTGLVQDTMVNDQIVFNVPDGGIFNNDTSVKTIYEYVGLPFVLNKETGVYSFDSDVNGAYFEGTPQSGTIDESGNITAHNLHFAEGAPQPMPNGLGVGDGSTNAFLPFNNQSSYNTNQVNYHFGMRADLPFSMTANGRVKSTDDTSAPITFTFSGDDDVWVFIDGHLVIDLGGIHNRLDATIDFANNTITYSEENAQDTNNVTASYNNADFAMTQQLFTADGVEGVIPQTRDAFALDQDHEMQVLYLERGEGTSNCRIEFNLPMNDTVIVTKDATKSWSAAAEEEDLKNGVDEDIAGVEPLTATEQASVNNIDFGFTLYKKAAGDEEATPVANTNFYLVGRGVDGTVINQTDAKGHFYLKNGQSAKFITDIPMEGVTYYVVEDQVPKGFISPDYNFDGEATYDYSYTDGTKTGTAPAADASQIPEQILPMPEEDAEGNVISWPVNKSYEVTVKGSVEANDSIEFICSNYLDAELPNPTALAYEDIIVIDYGLPVNIDPLANDVFRGDSVEIIAFGGADLTLGEVLDKDGDGIFEENELDITRDDTYDFGSVKFNDVTYGVSGDVTTRDTFTYTLNKQLTEVEVLTYIIKVTGTDEQDATHETLKQYDYAIGKVYIVPATVMYYEENFSDLVTFNNGKGVWDDVATTDASAVSANQEPGVAGTVGDSTYGSDVAYLSDSGDSNGTSRHGDTTDGAIQFTYTFTGTGTSFFARTAATTGYMQVKLYKGTDTSKETGECLDLTYRDTYYEDTNGTDEDSKGTLYNIPVYTQADLDYGTYTVVATIAKAGTKGAGAVGDDGYQHSGKDFYLDGIRIVQPLNESNKTVVNEETGETITEKALGAYSTDGEANVDIVTLRYKLITDAEEGNNAWNFVVLTDTNGQITTAEEYTSIGPKEEVYLMPGQSVSFAIKSWHKDGYLLHLGMKAPFGTAGVQVGQNTFELKNATDCYYNITDMQRSVVTADDGTYVAIYTISATDKIVSLTNLKVTGNYEFVLIEDTNDDVDGSEGGNE